MFFGIIESDSPRKWRLTAFHCMTYILFAFVLSLQSGCSQAEKHTDASVETEPPAGDSTTSTRPSTPKVEKGLSEYTVNVAPTTSGPVLTFEKTVHDFGEIDLLSKQTCEFRFQNTGGSLLTLQKKLESTCGCTVPMLDKTDYASGETGVIKVTFSAGSVAGPMQKQITVRSNDSQHALTRLTVKANIIQQITVTPAQLTLSPKEKNAGCTPITLRSRDGAPFAITQVRCSGDAITVPIDPNLKTAVYTVEPIADMDKLKTRPMGFLLITTTHPKCKTINIRYTLLREYQFKPSYLLLSNADPNQPVTREVWLTNNYGEDFEVEEVSSPRNLVRLLSQEKVPSVNSNEINCRLKLSITPPPVTKGQIVMDVFSVRLNNGKTLQLTFRSLQTRIPVRPRIRTNPR